MMYVWCAAPPSFHESAMGAWSVREKEEGEHVFGAQTYAPRYPVYQPLLPKC